MKFRFEIELDDRDFIDLLDRMFNLLEKHPEIPIEVFREIVSTKKEKEE